MQILKKLLVGVFFWTQCMVIIDCGIRQECSDLYICSVSECYRAL